MSITDSISYIVILLVVSTVYDANGWSFHDTVLDSSCPYSPISQDDVRDAIRGAKEAYKDHTHTVIPNTDYKVTYVISKKYKKKNVKVIVAESTSTVIVAFKGSHGGSQLLQEVYSVLKHPLGVTVNIAGQEMNIVGYFWDVFLSLKKDIDHIKQLWNPTKKFIVTGHSLGGALAAIFSLYVMTSKVNLWFNRHSKLITFGEPRVGDEDFSELHDKLIPPMRKLRVINEEDMVSHLPPYLLGYRHHSRGLWMKSYNEWRVCRKGESLISCSDTLFLEYTFDDHHIDEYMRKVFHSPSTIQVCASLFSKCDQYRVLSNALQSVCNGRK